MEWINYHHLLYFWIVAREGTVTAASKELRLAPSTISAQIHLLEEACGQKLFRRSGRTLVLTDMGKIVYRYAEEIFTLGREMVDTLKGRPTGQPVRLRVGVAMVVPKMVVYRLLQPVLQMDEEVRLICVENSPDKLLAELALHNLDVVITDSPMTPRVNVRAYNHLLGECDMTLFGAPALAQKYKDNFPACLQGAPFLLPTEHASTRRKLEQWFQSHNLRPKVVGEFQDSALKKVYGQAGLGLFAAPSIIADEICRQYGVIAMAQLDVPERFYAISIERRIKHPAISAITQTARRQVFAEEEIAPALPDPPEDDEGDDLMD
jgi:LysR family transcriptional activator of nhaA